MLDDGVAPVGLWLATVARNHVQDYLKSGKYQKAIRSASQSFPEYDAALEERLRLLRDGIGRLEARQQQILELGYFQRMTQTEM